MAQKFPYERASSILAEADLFGDAHVHDKYGVPRQTLWRWRDRAANDGNLSQSVTLKKRMLLLDWQQDAVQTIKVGMNELRRRMPLASTEEDAKVIHAIAGATKVIGELRITAEALASEAEPTNEPAYT